LLQGMAEASGEAGAAERLPRLLALRLLALRLLALRLLALRLLAWLLALVLAPRAECERSGRRALWKPQAPNGAEPPARGERRTARAEAGLRWELVETSTGRVSARQHEARWVAGGMAASSTHDEERRGADW